MGKNADRQLDFAHVWANTEATRRERFALLLSALKAVGANEKIRGVVMLVYNMQQSSNGDPLHWTAEKIGQEFRRSAVTARRWVRAAAGLGLLSVTETNGRRGGGRIANRLAIDWEGVKAIACSPDRTGAKPSDQAISTDQATDHERSVARSQLSNGLLESERANKECNSSGVSVAIPPPSVCGGGSSWSELEVALRKGGVHCVEKAIAFAQQADHTISTIWPLLEYHHDHRDGWGDPGRALYRRVALSPDIRATDGWEPFIEGYRPNQVHLDDQHRCLVAQLEEARDDLERSCGKRFDLLTRDERAKLAEKASRVAATLPAHPRRLLMLQILQQEESC